MAMDIKYIRVYQVRRFLGLTRDTHLVSNVCDDAVTETVDSDRISSIWIRISIACYLYRSLG